MHDKLTILTNNTTDQQMQEQCDGLVVVVMK